MVLGMSTNAFAANTGSGDTTSNGTFEGHVDKKVIEVMLPTVAVTSDTFAFTMDPEGLIEATTHAKYPDASFTGDTGVYFLSDTNTYTKDSKKLKVTNMGIADVDVTLTAQATVGATGVEVVANSGAAFDGASPNLYLGIVVDGTVSDSDAAVPETAVTDENGSAASVIVGLQGRDENYQISVSGNDYVYAKKSGIADTGWNSFEFGLTGACDKTADWSNVQTTGSTVKVTWAYAEAVSGNANKMLKENATDAPANEAPSISDVTYTKGSGDLSIPYSLGSGDLGAEAITDVAIEFGDTFYSINGLWGFSNQYASSITVDDDEIVIAQTGWLEYYTAGTYDLYVVYDNNDAIDATATYDVITITIQ